MSTTTDPAEAAARAIEAQWYGSTTHEAPSVGREHGVQCGHIFGPGADELAGTPCPITTWHESGFCPFHRDRGNVGWATPRDRLGFTTAPEAAR